MKLPVGPPRACLRPAAASTVPGPRPLSLGAPEVSGRRAVRPGVGVGSKAARGGCEAAPGALPSAPLYQGFTAAEPGHRKSAANTWGMEAGAQSPGQLPVLVGEFAINSPKTPMVGNHQ